MAAPEPVPDTQLEFVEAEDELADWPAEPESNSVDPAWADGQRLSYQREISPLRRTRRNDLTLSIASVVLGASAFLFGMIPIILWLAAPLPASLKSRAWMLFIFCGLGGTLAALIVSALARGRRGREKFIILSRALAFGWIPFVVIFETALERSAFDVLGIAFLCVVFLVPAGFVLLSLLDAVCEP